jgi:hypothetical protein
MAGGASTPCLGADPAIDDLDLALEHRDLARFLSTMGDAGFRVGGPIHYAPEAPPVIGSNDLGGSPAVFRSARDVA